MRLASKHINPPGPESCESEANPQGKTRHSREERLYSGIISNDEEMQRQQQKPGENEPQRYSLIQKTTSLFKSGGSLEPFKLLRSDLNGRFKIYATDWSFNQLVLASAVFVFFANLLPGITFASDLYVLTGANWGAIEVVLSTGICGIIFGLASAQPLTILGVTGPFCILSERIFELCHDKFHIPFLPFMAWSCIHSAWMQWLLAILNAHDWTMKYVTTFSTEIFALLNSVIYIHKASELSRAHDHTSFASFLYSIIGCIGTFLVAVTLADANKWKPLFHKYVRMFLSEYAAAISIIIFIGLPYVGELRKLDQQRLPISKTFKPSSPERSSFLVHFWHLEVGYVFAAMIPGMIITILFFFDVEVSTICATLKKYNLQKPGGYAWDVFLLGCTTGLCGILGLPPANGLLPQAPLHSESLLHDVKTVDGEGKVRDSIQRVHEQRWSHLLHALAILSVASPPLMKVIGLTPTSVLAGLFLYMAEQSLRTKPPSELPNLPAGISSYKRIHLFTLLQIVLTGIIFGVTFTPAAPIFPLIIIILVPIRLNVMEKWWSKEELSHVDAWACADEDPRHPDLRRVDNS